MQDAVSARDAALGTKEHCRWAKAVLENSEWKNSVAFECDKCACPVKPKSYREEGERKGLPFIKAWFIIVHCPCMLRIYSCVWIESGM
jgi:hypothetical protein